MAAKHRMTVLNVTSTPGQFHEQIRSVTPPSPVVKATGITMGSWVVGVTANA